MTREEQLEKALSDVLDIMNSDEMKAEAFCAWNHGVRCDPEVSKRNGKIIEAAYKLLGKERHEQKDG